MFDRRRGLRAATLAITALGASCATTPVTVQREFALMSEAPEGILPFPDDEAEFAGLGSIQSYRPLSPSEAGSTPPRSRARIKVVVES